jgi:hypothetical protein
LEDRRNSRREEEVVEVDEGSDVIKLSCFLAFELCGTVVARSVGFGGGHSGRGKLAS